MEHRNKICIYFRDLTDKKDLSIKEAGVFNIGLVSDGTLAVKKDTSTLCVLLLTVTVTDTGGTLLAPANTDLQCHVNGFDVLTREINLINGARLEVASKKLVFINGPIPKMRRKLPPTPGMPRCAAPPKPARLAVSMETSGKQLVSSSHDQNTVDDTEKRWLETSWCLLDRPQEETSMFQDFDTPEQIAILSASYFTKQLRLYTDAVVTSELLDNIFKMFMDTVVHCRLTYLNYLSSLSRMLSKSPDRSHTRPMHAPAVVLLTELLQQCFDPVSRLVLILDLLRTFSHFDQNLVTMVTCKTAAAVMGSMSAYLDVIEVQQLSLDIIAKLAQHKPGINLNKKSPIREAAVDMVSRAAKHHHKDLGVARAACRVLASISSSLVTALNSWMESESGRLPSNMVMVAVDTYMAVLEYVFKEGIPVVQEVLTYFHDDLGVSTEGRKFIYYYAKLPQIQHKKNLIQKQLEERVTEADAESSTGSSGTWTQSDVPQPSSVFKSVPVEEPEPQGILKKARSYENLRTRDKRLYFAGDTEGGSPSDTDSSLLSSSDSDSGTSWSDSDVSEHENENPEFESKICKDINMEDDFSFHVVKSLVKKTIRRRKSRKDGKYAVNKSVDDEVDTDDEFIDSFSKMNSKKTNIIYKPDAAIEHSVPSNNSNYDTKEDLSDGFAGKVIDKDSPVPEVVLDREVHVNEETANIKGVQESDGSVEDVKTDVSASNIEVVTGDEQSQVVEQVSSTTSIPPVPAPRKKNLATPSKQDIPFMGNLVRTQIICHIGRLVFKGDDSEALMVIDRPIKSLLEDSNAPVCLRSFCEERYGASMTLMDLEPAIVISVIDAVRYRSLTQELVQSAVLTLTRGVSETLNQSTIDCLMLFYKELFAETSLKPILTENKFLEEFRTCFQNAVSRLGRVHNIDDIHNHIKSEVTNFAV